MRTLRLNLAGRLRAHRRKDDDWDGPLSRADIVAILTAAILTAAADRYQAEAAEDPTLTLDEWLREP